MLGQLAGQHQAHGRLDLARRDRRLLVVAREARRLGRDLVEDVVDERVHDRHGLRRDAGVGVHLLEHLRRGRKEKSGGRQTGRKKKKNKGVSASLSRERALHRAAARRADESTPA